MKRTLLVSAFAVMALAASAQISEVTKVKGDFFAECSTCWAFRINKKSSLKHYL